MKAQSIYLPVSVMCAAVALMLLHAAFLQADPDHDQLQRLMITSVKMLFYVPALLVGMILAGMFGYSFTPIHRSGLQLLAATLGPAAMRGVVGHVAGDFIGMVLGAGLFLGLIGCFFNEDAMESLVAIFLVFAAHTVVTFVLTPLFIMYFV
ncbi:MAG: hypothetical protein P8Z79_09780 [Sedimentisphaerales bacterium]|jgi:hypothetical protein